MLNEQNYLQEIVISKFPIIKKILFELRSLKKCQFSRLTGSGSACFGVFLTKKSADLGLKKSKKDFPSFGVLLVKLFKFHFLWYIKKLNWGVAKR